jgi:GTP-binding protein HflX
VLVYPNTNSGTDDLDELRDLSISAGAEPVASLSVREDRPDPRYFMGTGKLDELAGLIAETGAELVLFNHALKPSQERNLEKALSVRVVDRTGLILDIFAQRAQTFEGKLQVELAQLRHLATRLVRGWTHLERQKGGIGLRGPGETQLETDKRLLANRIRQILKRLEKVDQQRNQGRLARKKADVPVVGLVGYTNAGKSTLFNALTQAGVFAADQLFATLDPTLRKLSVAPNHVVILADTVGFIRQLPHELVAAFKSTLKEVSDADLLLHIIDANDVRMHDTIMEVESVLEEIGADSVPRIQVFNKLDLQEGRSAFVERNEQGQVDRVWLSAARGDGLDLLLGVLDERLFGTSRHFSLRVAPADAVWRARLFQYARVLHEKILESGGWEMEVVVPARALGSLAEVGLILEPRTPFEK